MNLRKGIKREKTKSSFHRNIELTDHKKHDRSETFKFPMPYIGVYFIETEGQNGIYARIAGTQL